MLKGEVNIENKIKKSLSIAPFFAKENVETFALINSKKQFEMLK